jgi:hypothetical protein
MTEIPNNKSETPCVPAREMMLRLQVPPDATQFDIAWYSDKGAEITLPMKVDVLEEAPPHNCTECTMWVNYQPECILAREDGATLCEYFEKKERA